MQIFSCGGDEVKDKLSIILTIYFKLIICKTCVDDRRTMTRGSSFLKMCPKCQLYLCTGVFKLLKFIWFVDCWIKIKCVMKVEEENYNAIISPFSLSLFSMFGASINAKKKQGESCGRKSKT